MRAAAAPESGRRSPGLIEARKSAVRALASGLRGRGVAVTTSTIESRLTLLWDRPKTLYGWLSTVDHKEIGLRYLVTAFLFLVAGGVEAILIRTQLARPEAGVLSPEAYDQIFSMHGITMIFWYASPILSGFANYLIPPTHTRIRPATLPAGSRTRRR